MTDTDVLAVKIDTVQQDLKELKAELAELRKDLKPALDLLARHDERIASLAGWRNGLTAGFGALALGFLKTFFKF